MTTQMHWTIEDLPWSRLATEKANPELLKVVKAAALVEYNAESYADYLSRVFTGNSAFQDDIRQWAAEEVQHGKALGAWAEAIDPHWCLEDAMARFRAGYTIAHFANDESVRGSRTGELISRCMVETGTSSYYSAIGAATDEPVLKDICAKIAADEFHHYKLFYTYLKRYLDMEDMTTFKRLRIALSRIAETEDDELSYAYYAANARTTDPYDRKRYNTEYMSRAYSYYREPQVDRAVAMIFKACGLKPQTMAHKAVTKMAWWMLQKNVKNAEKAAS